MDLNKTFHKVVVVEGYHDLSRIKEIYPNIDIVITNGSEVSKETLQELKQLQNTRGLILFTDPDVPGERIRRLIQNHVGETSHAFVPKSECISKNGKKVGIEHASRTAIIHALSNFKQSTEESISTLTMSDLFELKLTGCMDAKQRRKLVSEELGIGLVNGKSLLRKLHMFNITKTQLEQILSR